MSLRAWRPSVPVRVILVAGLACSAPTEISDPVMSDLAGTWRSDARELTSALDPTERDRSDFGYPECDPPDEPPVSGTVLQCHPRPIIMTVVPDTATSNIPGVTGEYAVCTTRWVPSSGDTIFMDAGSVRVEDIGEPDRSVIRLTCAFEPVWNVTSYTFRLTDRTLELAHDRTITRSWAERIGFTVPDSVSAIEVRETLTFNRLR